MIDLHTHILPHMDDGAKETAISVEMLQQELRQGVDTVVLTSHYYGRKKSPKDFIIKRNTMYHHLKERKTRGVKTLIAAEVHFTGVNVADYEDLCLLAIEGTKYILMEFPFTTKWDRSILGSLAEFVSETGYTPIIAHAERYPEVQKNPALLTELMDMGCLIQVNIGSFTDRREKRLAFAIVKHGMLHCLGTDAHDTGLRAPDWSNKEILFDKGYKYEWDRAQDIMEKVVAGEQVRVEPCKPIKKFLWYYI